jgi:hypothetical protein
MESLQNKRTWFTDRLQEEYIEALHEALSIDNLTNNAITIPTDLRGYEKIVRIDFCGIASSTLLLNAINGKKNNINQRFCDIFKHLKKFDEQKIRVKTRFLFMYLYSDFSYAQVEAEKTEYRATIENKKYDDYKNLDLLSLTEKDFYSSRIYDYQVKALKQIQKIHNDFFSHREHSDILNVRFCCLPLNFCSLTINNKSYIDAYSYAKRDSNSGLSYENPLISISQINDASTFDTIEDHFRYMWNHPTTLFYEDATKSFFDEENENKLQQLEHIKMPHNVSFDTKAQRIKERFPSITDEKINRWKFRVERMFSNMTRIMETSPESETVFIGFSFKNGKGIADETRTYLEEDFLQSLKVFIVDIMDGQDPLYDELTNKMKGATIGLIFFTKDIEESLEDTKNYYSRPNLYFEFGYLLNHVEKYGPPLSRIMIFSEDGLITPSDFQDLARYPLIKNPLLDYCHIIEKILKINRTLTERIAINAVNKFVERLQTAYNNKKIIDKDLNGKTFNDFKNETKIKLTNVIKKRFKK